MRGGGSQFGGDVAGSRAGMSEQGPPGYALIEKFVPPYLTYTPELPADFAGTFSMRFNPAEPYTYKTRHLTSATLTGDENANLIGNGRDNVLSGNSGNNIIQAGGGNDELDGGDGEDAAVFAGPAMDYEIVYNRGSVMVRDLKEDRDGSDLLRGIERLRFSDSSVQLRSEDAAETN